MKHRVTIEEAAERLEELVDLANAGDDVFIISEDGNDVRIAPLSPGFSQEER